MTIKILSKEDLIKLYPKDNRMNIIINNFKETSDENGWLCYDLETHGNTLGDCLRNACVYSFDSDYVLQSHSSELCDLAKRLINEYWFLNSEYIPRRTFRLDRLSHQFKVKGIYLTSFADRLHAAGFIDTVGNDRYSECDKLTNGDNKDELFKIVGEYAKRI